MNKVYFYEDYCFIDGDDEDSEETLERSMIYRELHSICEDFTQWKVHTSCLCDEDDCYGLDMKDVLGCKIYPLFSCRLYHYHGVYLFRHKSSGKYYGIKTTTYPVANIAELREEECDTIADIVESHPDTLPQKNFIYGWSIVFDVSDYDVERYEEKHPWLKD